MNLLKKIIIVCGFSLAPGLTLAQSDHGTATKLGVVTVAGRELSVTKLGTIEAGKEAAFQVNAAEPGEKKLSELSVYLWLEDQSGAQVSAPGKGIVEGGALHFHVTPKVGSKPKRVVVRVRDSGKDDKATLPLDGHGHEHATSAHGGSVAALKDEQDTTVGYVELKLHDDKGDLELWLAKNENFTQPFELSLDSSVRVKFIDHSGRIVELKPRNALKNEDEDGVSNVRNGMTNYFIFPLTAEDDSTWLKGGEFQSIVQVSFDSDGRELESEEFILVPHTHSDQGHHH